MNRTLVAAAALSNLDLIVHVPDLPLYGNSAQVGLGLWNARTVTFLLEGTLLLSGVWRYTTLPHARAAAAWPFGALLLVIQGYNTYIAPPPSSDRLFAVTALVAYGVFAAVAWWLERRTARA